MFFFYDLLHKNKERMYFLIQSIVLNVHLTLSLLVKSRPPKSHNLIESSLLSCVTCKRREGVKASRFHHG